MYPHRTMFAENIVTEWFPPFFSFDNLSEKHPVFIICGGMPGVPDKRSLLSFFAKKGYWAFFPRYRGTWESGGRFLDHDPYTDILDLMDALEMPFQSVFSGETADVHGPDIYLIGGSFGGPAAMLVSKDPRVKGVVTVAGVVDWTASGEEEHMDKLLHSVREGFGEAYRFDDVSWQELSQGRFYNPVTMGDKIDTKKILMIHAKNDKIVPFATSQAFAKEQNIPFISITKGGHLSLSIVQTWRMWRKIKKHLAV